MFRANCGGREWDRISIRRTGNPDSCRRGQGKKCVTHMQLMRQQVYYGIPQS